MTRIPFIEAQFYDPSDNVHRIEARLQSHLSGLRKKRLEACVAATRPPVPAMIGLIDDHRVVHGVESICKVLPIAPFTYYACLAVRADPSKASAGHQRDAVLRPKIQKVWDNNWEVYGVSKAWRQLCREGEAVARCTVARLMKGMGLRGTVRGKAMKTTIPDTSVPCPRDKVNRKFRAPAPNMLCPYSDARASLTGCQVSDFTYVSTWQGFVYVAFVIDIFANRIVGWKASRSAKTDFVLDALEQAIYARRPTYQGGPIHHSDRGGQYVSIRYTERLAKAGIEPSVGSVGDAYDRASGRHWFKTTGEGFGRNDQLSLQNRGHQAAQFMENNGRGRAGNPQMGRLVQQPSPA